MYKLIYLNYIRRLVFSIGESAYQRGGIRIFFKNENLPHAITPRKNKFFILKKSKFQPDL